MRASRLLVVFGLVGGLAASCGEGVPGDLEEEREAATDVPGITVNYFKVTTTDPSDDALVRFEARVTLTKATLNNQVPSFNVYLATRTPGGTFFNTCWNNPKAKSCYATFYWDIALPSGSRTVWLESGGQNLASVALTVEGAAVSATLESIQVCEGVDSLGNCSREIPSPFTLAAGATRYGILARFKNLSGSPAFSIVTTRSSGSVISDSVTVLIKGYGNNRTAYVYQNLWNMQSRGTTQTSTISVGSNVAGTRQVTTNAQ